MKKIIIILFGLIQIAYGQTIKVSPGISVLVPADTVLRYIRPLAGTNMTITGTFPNLTFNATASGSGTVTGVSVATANGFAGTSSGGTTPIITLTTPITGILKGNGTAISAATAGTDYGRVDSVRLVNSGLIHTPTAAFSLVGNTAVLTQNLATQTANTLLAGPGSGAAALPTFRALVPLDIPTLNQNTTGTSGGLSANITESQVTNLTSDLALKAPLASPTFTGTPTLPTGSIATTQTAGNNTTAIATTAFVAAAISGGGLTSSNFIFNEQFTGSATSSYTLANTPVTGKLSVFKNGMLITDYTLSGAIVTLGSARLTTDIFTNNYIR